jgi:hypothetical protein
MCLDEIRGDPDLIRVAMAALFECSNGGRELRHGRFEVAGRQCEQSEGAARPHLVAAVA